MSNIITLSRPEKGGTFEQEERDPNIPVEETPHLQGPAVCLACKHEWQSVSPVGVVKLECPACGTERGVYATPVEQAGDHWVCVCSNHYFAITRQGVYCPSCGKWQKFPLNGEK